MLNSLEIKNFRMLEDFTVAKLGRINLIVGKNNSGKSTVLEALRIYAVNAQRELLVNIAASHDEAYQFEYGKMGDLNQSMPFEDLFTGRRFPDDDTEIVIGESMGHGSLLRISYRISIDDNELKLEAEEIAEVKRSGFGQAVTKSQYINLVRKRGADFVTKREELLLIKNKNAISILLNDEFLTNKRASSIFSRTEFSDIRSSTLHDALGITPCSFIPTQLIPADELATEWDNIVGTEHEETVKQAMRIILPEFENLYFVQNNNASPLAGGSQRTAKVKLPNLPRPVPLKSLGDGMIRVLQLALKLVSAQGGFLLIDEFENGLHYSVQEKVWALLFEMAEKLDIQVFATTHSWDCIESFTKVAIERKDVGGVLFRMGKSVRTSDKGKVIATVFSEDELATMTQIDMEIR
jgi:AAA15 family ATPase/GTPase